MGGDGGGGRGEGGGRKYAGDITEETTISELTADNDKDERGEAERFYNRRNYLAGAERVRKPARATASRDGRPYRWLRAGAVACGG